MKAIIKHTFIILSLAVIAASTLSSCRTTGEPTHTMGHKTNTWPMKNSEMPGY